MNTSTQKPPIKIPYWRTQLGEEEAAKVREAILGAKLSQGSVTVEFEKRVCEMLEVPYAVATTSCSMALYLALWAADIGHGDEVIVPNHTFIATAHAVLTRGAKVRLVDVRPEIDLIDERLIEAAITKKTKAIIPVHTNGNPANIDAINAIAKKHGLVVIEDAAQAFSSKNENGYLGTQADMGCYSLGPTKLITTGQGGLVVTRNEELYHRMVRLRNHGVDNVFRADFQDLGFNLKFTDVAASIGLIQLRKVPAKKRLHHRFYEFYKKGLAGLDYIKLLPVATERGAQPLWVEAMCAEREKVAEMLEQEGIETRPFTDDLHHSKHLGNVGGKFPNSAPFSKHGIYLPCGPDVPESAWARTIEVLHAIKPKIRSRIEWGV